jgi:hypothetical protein
MAAFAARKTKTGAVEITSVGRIIRTALASNPISKNFGAFTDRLRKSVRMT